MLQIVVQGDVWAQEYVYNRTCAPVQLAGGAGKAFAVLTTDQEYINRFRSRPMTYRERLLHGVQAAGVGIYEGVIGIVKEPSSAGRWLAMLYGGLSH